MVAVEIPDNLLCLFTARVEQRDGDYVIDVPTSEFEHGPLDAGGTYRVAVFPTPGSPSDADATGEEHEREPPVEEGDVRQVEIEGLGDQGDGIARVDRGYVVIVPGTEVGERVTVEIEECFPNFAMARVIGEE